jgi:hypothetical protein
MFSNLKVGQRLHEGGRGILANDGGGGGGGGGGGV